MPSTLWFINANRTIKSNSTASAHFSKFIKVEEVDKTLSKRVSIFFFFLHPKRHKSQFCIFLTLPLWVLLEDSAEHHNVVLWLLLTGQNEAEATVSDVKLPVFICDTRVEIIQAAADTWWALRYFGLFDFLLIKHPQLRSTPLRLSSHVLMLSHCKALYYNTLQNNSGLVG